MEKKIFYWICLIIVFAAIVFLIPLLTSSLFGFVKFSPGILMGVAVLLLIKNRLRAYVFEEPARENKQLGLAIGLIVLSLVWGTIASINAYMAQKRVKQVWENGVMDNFLEENFEEEQERRAQMSQKFSERMLTFEVEDYNDECPVYFGNQDEVLLASVQMDTVNRMVSYVFKIQNFDKRSLRDSEFESVRKDQEKRLRDGFVSNCYEGNVSAFDSLVVTAGYGMAVLYFDCDSTFLWDLRLPPEEFKAMLYGKAEE